MMRVFIIILVLFPALACAQDSAPKFQNDTLYTSSGYKIYIGQTLSFGKAAGLYGKFKHLVIHNDAIPKPLENNFIIVDKLSDFHVLTPGDSYIEISGSIRFRNGSKGTVYLRLFFDRAIAGLAGQPGELITPLEFSSKPIPSNWDYEPRFENDTLYTSCGFKIYIGQTLQFGKGTLKGGRFKYINIKGGNTSANLANTTVLVNELRNFGISSLGNGYIEIFGTINYKDGTTGAIDLHIAFDRAIENSLDLPSELIVPMEYRNIKALTIRAEIEKLYALYREGSINKTEYEARVKKLNEE